MFLSSYILFTLDRMWGFFISPYSEKWRHLSLPVLSKGHPLSADLRYGEEDSISPSTLVLAAIKG